MFAALPLMILASGISVTGLVPESVLGITSVFIYPQILHLYVFIPVLSSVAALVTVPLSNVCFAILLFSPHSQAFQ